MRKSADGWKAPESLCHPDAGKARDGPYACELRYYRIRDYLLAFAPCDSTLS